MSSGYTSREDFPEELPHEATFFCMHCRAAPVEKVPQRDGTVRYHCHACGDEAERFLAWDPGMEQYFNKDGELVHSGGGVIVHDRSGRVLLFRQVKYPFLWTIPGGHMDADEDPRTTAARELYEETRLTAPALHPVFAGEIRGDRCVGGADIHFWYAYACQVADGTEPVIAQEEGREWGWFARNELPELSMPVGYLFSLPEVMRSLDERGPMSDTKD